ncbi:Sensor histidine kinase ComP [Chryseobacterium sp. MOF25P]|uniref:tetratricopeptide repeat-containing sensor histidine kinase n=1 Tax=unclassified Chryseobacterium TaxID=2593645 RepID=UPI000804D09A|nr:MULTISPECIES: ATP-binding protein [unclassified Chryseobacterium]OBW43266.1 Sensor histidine kinase ComP [Chryseobacterium sp. MOF25P]OBW46472.1 Sensor histidine kinase ComP [Chryseobacterium sp. BGARF1]
MQRIIYILILLLFCSCNKKNNIEYFGDNNTCYQKAKDFRDSNISDSAFYYYNKAKESYKSVDDTLGIAKSLVNMAIIQQKQGDFYGSIETSTEANNFLKKISDSTIRSTLAANNNNIGICSAYLYNYDDAIIFYTKALNDVTTNENKYVYCNNIADVFISTKKYNLAKQYLKIAMLTKDSADFSRALNNIAKAKLLENKNYDPIPELVKSLKIRERNNDFLGQNSSFATLSNYYFDRDKKIAFYYANKMMNTAMKNNSLEDQSQALQKMIYLDSKNYLNYFKRFQPLNDSIQITKNKAKNQFALIRFDSEKNKADNLKLQKDNTVKGFQIYSISILALIAGIAGIIYYKKRKQRLLLESENKLKEQQLKTSKKVHDVVANGIYQVMTKIENQNDFNKEQTLDELEYVYEKSRDISYEDPDSHDEKFNEKISKLVASFKNDEIKTFTVGNQEETWENVTKSTQTEIYQIIRELLVNMKKHSKASNVALRFEKINNIINIHYTDNGIGISNELIFKNGLSNTVSRIENIAGKITFETKTEKGLKVNISFPVS